MTDEGDQQKEKRALRVSPYYYVCMAVYFVIIVIIAAIVTATIKNTVAEKVVTVIVVLGGLGITVYFILSSYKASNKDEQKQ